ncbi:hypothetical protein V6Z12_D11G212300 [Gossypium hirsutum]|uniref:Vacuolar-processing enzyme-like n=1 Tax=Gossypium hirsutum TaxID=3635 RepID=A0ABM3B617_GOSHI|nr:vacuolar-processing enzyme-like [Gossypium hirsutum]
MKPIVLESRWGTYCPGEYPSPPPEYETCLGDLYSVAWMEDIDIHNLRKETLHQQYELVKRRTSNSPMGTHCCHPPKLLISAMLILSISGISIARHLMSWLGRLKLKSRLWKPCPIECM